jgi:hypothetical protein
LEHLQGVFSKQKGDEMAAKTMLHQSPLGRHFLDRPNMVTLATCGRQPQTLRNGSKLPQYCKKSLETEMLGSNALVSTQSLFVKPAMRTDGGIDRRRHPRLRLSYLLRLLRPGHSTGIQTQTEDLSCDGFYCIADHPVLPQEMVECELLIPGELAGDPLESGLVLRCRAEVVRVVPDPLAPRFGIACRLEAYTVNRNIAGRTWCPLN